MSCIFKGAEKLVEHLVKHNIPIAISTGSTDRGYELKSSNYKLFFSNFQFILRCSSDAEVKYGKPHPDAFEVARKRFQPELEKKYTF